MSAQSDLYWAMRVGFADAHLGNTDQHHSYPDLIGDALERIETITSSTARHVLRAEQTLESLNETLRERLPFDKERCKENLKEALPLVWELLPRQPVDYLVQASVLAYGSQKSYSNVALGNAVASLFTELIERSILNLVDAKDLVLRGHNRTLKLGRWHKFPLGDWAYILNSASTPGKNPGLLPTLIQAFPDAGPEAVVNLSPQLQAIADLRNRTAHPSSAPSQQSGTHADELWNIVVGNDGNGGFLTKFYSALGIIPEA